MAARLKGLRSAFVLHDAHLCIFELHTAAPGALRQIHSAAFQGQTKNAQDSAVRERKKWKQKQVFVAPTREANVEIQIQMQTRHFGKYMRLKS